MFCELKKFSPMANVSVPADNKVVPLSDKVVPLAGYMEAMNRDHQERRQKMEQDYQRRTTDYKRRAVALAVGGLVGCLVCTCAVAVFALKRISAAEETLAAFAQKFEHVDAFNNGNILASDDLVLVSDVLLEDSPDIENAVEFSCSLAWNGRDHGVCIGKDAAIIVILKDGTVKEYDLWNTAYPFKTEFRLGSRNGWYGKTQGNIAVHSFYDIEIADISYIKLTNLNVYKMMQYKFEDLSVEYEIELYKAK